MTTVKAEPLHVLRKRTSEKWVAYPPSILPLFVAEMDYPLAPVVAEAIIERVRASDTGYVSSPGPIAPAFSRFAARRWNWDVSPESIRTTTDVSVAIVESLRMVLSPGDGVIVTPPVYPPFFELVPEAGGTVVEVPLLAPQEADTDWQLDLEGIDAAFAAGARAILLCNPHNPVGMVHSRHSLAALAELAERHGAFVVSDEIHAPLVRDTAGFTPYLSVSPAAREHGIVVTSASKAFNLAGTKCAIMIAASARTLELLDAMPEEVGVRTSLLGLHASVAAFEHGDEWLAGARSAIAESSDLLTALLADRLPVVAFRPPAASYLAWLDFRGLGWGDDPATIALEAGVALNSGLTFGREGAGFARLNLACSAEVLTEAISRLETAARTS